MSAMQQSQQRWDTSRYMRIVNVVHLDGQLTVAFADDTRSTVDTRRLMTASAREPHWNDLAFTDYEIVVPAEDQNIEISWLTIRSLTDPEFDAYLREQARHEATRIGRRLQEIREGHHLSRAELAARAGLPATTLEVVEQGRAGLDLKLLATMLASVGHTLNDLAVPSTDEPESGSANERRSLARSGRSRQL